MSAAIRGARDPRGRPERPGGSPRSRAGEVAAARPSSPSPDVPPPRSTTPVADPAPLLPRGTGSRPSSLARRRGGPAPRPDPFPFPVSPRVASGGDGDGDGAGSIAARTERSTLAPRASCSESESVAVLPYISRLKNLRHQNLPKFGRAFRQGAGGASTSTVSGKGAAARNISRRRSAPEGLIRDDAGPHPFASPLPDDVNRLEHTYVHKRGLFCERRAETAVSDAPTDTTRL